MEKPDAPKKSVPAVTRAVAILRFLGQAKEPMGVNPIARALGIVPSTCLHILRVLVDEGLVRFDPVTKHHALDVGILTIARTAIQRNDFIQLVPPYLVDLSSEFGATVLATQVNDAAQVVVVALSEVPQPFRLQVDLGSRFPALISATGRLNAPYTPLDEETLRDGFDRLAWDKPPRFDAWAGQVAECRAPGYDVVGARICRADGGGGAPLRHARRHGAQPRDRGDFRMAGHCRYSRSGRPHAGRTRPDRGALSLRPGLRPRGHTAIASRQRPAILADRMSDGTKTAPL